MLLKKENVHRYTHHYWPRLLQSLIVPFNWLAKKVLGIPFVMTYAFISDDDTQRMLYAQISGCDYIRCRTLGLIAQGLHERYGESIKNYRVAELGVLRGHFAGLINELFPECTFYMYDTFSGYDKRDLEHDNKKGMLDYKGDFNDRLRETSINYVLSRMPFKDKCAIREGYFPDTVQDEEKHVRFCFVSLDANLYNPMHAGLEFFYPRLVDGGAIMLHDYNSLIMHGVKQAVLDFEKQYGAVAKIPLPDFAGSLLIVKP
ncbi:MAG: TylF/MycF family methyltransferase [Desulfovibrionaceae bacterium]|nr:TylF/MycF family methyltransferase [Desulfovibrionaceae bacterium]